MATTYDIPDHIRGDSFPGLSFAVTVNAVKMDLTSAKIRMKMVLRDNTAKTFLLTTENGYFTITDAPNGEFTLNNIVIDPGASGLYDYEIEIIMPSGAIHTYITGTWEITGF